jgi:hypothetical protein
MTVMHKNKLPTGELIYSGRAFVCWAFYNGVGFISFIAGRLYSVVCILPLFWGISFNSGHPYSAGCFCGFYFSVTFWANLEDCGLRFTSLCPCV